ncbi:MAG: HEAT repeat domain-containing protein [Planctomycetes bacterium]|nr:HEAT repeat domain-containing protein [Planctomycetota bacterium]
MTFADTLQYLACLPVAQQVDCLTAALLERDEVVQRGAAQVLLGKGIRRPDLVVDHWPGLLPTVQQDLAVLRQELLPVARDKIVGGRDAKRLAAFRMVDELGDTAAAELLAVGICDSIAEVATVAIDGVLRRVRTYAAARRKARESGDAEPVSRDAGQETAWQAFGSLLRRAPESRHAELCALLFEFGAVSLSLFRSVLLTQREGGIGRTFVQALGTGDGIGAAQLAVALALDLEPALQRIGLQVLRERRDAAFATGVARAATALTDDRAVAMVRSLRELPWWGAVQHAVPTLPVADATAVLALLVDATIAVDLRQAAIETFCAHPDGNVQVAAVAALRRTGVVGGFHAVGRLLAGGAAAGQRAAAQLVVDLAPPDRVALLTPLLGADDVELRRLAVREVSKVSFARYLDRFDGMDERQRAVAGKALAKIDAQMLDRLAGEIGALDAARRLKALQIVDVIGAGQDLRTPLLELLDDPDRRVRATAVRIVELAGSVEGVQVLLGALGDPDRRVRANAIEAFEELDDPRYVKMLQPFLRDPDNRVRANAAKALWNLGRTEVRDELLAMLDDKDEMARVSAVWAIGEIAFPGARELLLAREDSDRSGKVRAKIREVTAAMAAGATEAPR